MKKLLLALIIIISAAAQAQDNENVFTALTTSGPYGGILLDGEDLYVASEFNGEIYKIHAYSESNDYTAINSGGTGSMQTGLYKLGNDLYVNRWHDNAVIKVSADGTGTPETIATIAHPEGLTGKNNKLYVTSGNKIFEVNLATTPATVATIIEGLDVAVSGPEIGLKIYDNYLYVSEINKISRINLDVQPYVKETFVTLPFTPLSFTKAYENEFYATSNDYTNLYIIFTDSGESTIFLTPDSLTYPTANDLVYDNGALFVACMEGTNVMRVMAEVFATDSFSKPTLTVYPNPATNYIAINGLTIPEEATIINTLGQTVARYRAAQKYDVTVLPPGVYYLKLKDISLKFIKE
ncbi:T9SS type A sorting domain-containing protein [Flavobacterium sp. RHBU_24]|uniref:T9SS type A sorting domain-containing protein n=1 Tax=Flavobacterium sp. RHBU_24 TaxID=3391185 RepID=UPI00398529C3